MSAILVASEKSYMQPAAYLCQKKLSTFAKWLLKSAMMISENFTVDR